jgi:hypothetical protein
MNPEGIFIQATAPSSKNPSASFRDNSDIGYWLPSSSLPDATPSNPGHRYEKQVSQPPTAFKSELAGKYEQIKHQYLQECLQILPPQEDFQEMKRLFRERIQPFYPVLNEDDLENAGQTTVFAILSAQAIALAIATDPESSSHLRLAPDGPVLPFLEFHQRLSTAMVEIIDAELLTNRINLTRILLLLAMFYQPSNANQRDRAAVFFSQAIHHFQTVGAHLQGYRPRHEDENIDTLYCAIWAMDSKHFNVCILSLGTL